MEITDDWWCSKGAITQDRQKLRNRFSQNPVDWWNIIFTYGKNQEIICDFHAQLTESRREVLSYQ